MAEGGGVAGCTLRACLVSSQTDLVELDRSADVATLILNRPERHNSLVPALLEGLLQHFETITADRRVRAVVLAAEGRSFSTGGDVRAFFDSGDRVADYALKTVGLLNEVIVAMLRLPQPVVAAAHGMVTGGSLGLLLASDVVLIAPEATITPWYAVVGYSPDGGWVTLLPRILGPRRTGEIIMRNQTISAESAVAWGLAAEVVPAGDIRDRAGSVASEMASMVPGSIAATRRLLWGDLDVVATDLEKERQEFVAQIQADEAYTGMQRFLGRER